MLGSDSDGTDHMHLYDNTRSFYVDVSLCVQYEVVQLDCGVLCWQSYVNVHAWWHTNDGKHSTFRLPKNQLNPS